LLLAPGMLAIVLTFVAPVVIAAFFAFAPTSYIERVGNIHVARRTDMSASRRLQAWGVAWTITKREPIGGALKVVNNSISLPAVHGEGEWGLRISRRRRGVRLVASLVTLAMLAVSCGGSEAAAPAATPTPAPTATPAPTRCASSLSPASARSRAR